MPASHRNVELKGHDPDPAATLAAALALGAVDHGILTQRDTYFAVREGRLKLREEDRRGPQLIAYTRADDAAARTSTYHRVDVSDPAGLVAALGAALGVTVVIEKRRRLLLLGATRFHLDDVTGLGRYVELEAVAAPESDLYAEHLEVTRLREALGLTDDRVVAEGYAQLLLARNVNGGSPSRDEGEPTFTLPGGTKALDEDDATRARATERLVALARDVREHAHAPYSRFGVGAALRDERGGLHVGANVENASYPQGQCAETSAIGALIASGARRIEEIAVLADAELVTPCGGCRQRLAELARADVPVHLCGPEGIRRTVTLGELLPLAFGLEPPPA